MLIIITAALAIGLLNGFINRLALSKVMTGPDNVFFTVWGLGLAYRFVFLMAAIVLCWKFRVPHKEVFLVTLAIAQSVPQAGLRQRRQR